jgi:FKBP-type peptidyl-prolyl cis-trans isomerase FklB
MKRYLILLFATGFFAAQTYAQDKPAVKEDKPVLSEGKAVLKDQKDKVSYSIGQVIASDMKQQRLDINPDLIVLGFQDGFSGKKALLSEAERKQVMEDFEKEMEARMAKEEKELPEKNKKEGEAFLAENKKKEGVKTHPVKLSDGKIAELQYKVLREGTGPTPKMEDKVKTHYRGTLLNGTQFDSSYDRNEPTSFGLRQVIKGWQEALQMMKVGSKYQLFIPSELAYGERGADRLIGPNATLIFDIELLSIEKP